MENLELLKMLPNIGSIAVFLYLTLMYMKDRAEEQKNSRDDRAAAEQLSRSERAETNKMFVDRLSQIEANHREEERSDREQHKELFDRVIVICGELSKAVTALDAGVRGLSTATQANERAIVDLREEMTKLRHIGDWRDDDKGKEPRRPRPAPQDRPSA